MPEQLLKARSNDPTVIYGGQALHSRYDPRGEAEKYIASLRLKNDIRFFVLIECGLGYIIPPLRKNFPKAKIIAVHASAYFSDITARIASFYSPASYDAGELLPDSRWFPGYGKNQDIDTFLEGEIPDTDAAFIKIVEWRPGLTVYRNAYAEIMSKAVNCIKRLDANKRTVRGFGCRWVRNFFRNIRIMRRALSLRQPVDLPFIVCGAGPGLEGVIPLLRELKDKARVFVLAASSAAEALLAGGVHLDIVIGTDGGGWALFHLWEYLRLPPENTGALAVQSCAAIPSQCTDVPLLTLADGSLWQGTALSSCGIPFIRLPQRGTVTASALDLAFKLNQGPVFICGMNLASEDIVSHARPYRLNGMMEEKAARLSPYYSQQFIRTRALRKGGMDIYARWFKDRLASYPERLYTLGKNHSVFDALPKGEDILLKRVSPRPRSSAAGRLLEERDVYLPCRQERLFAETSLNPNENRADTALKAVLRAFDNPQLSPLVQGELAPLLFPDEEQVSCSALRKKIARAAQGGRLE
ncbi:MAG: DUF115 domain-containing protein [Treponema sp.]|jgi:hypothetical protein|nr:DUF115 domain-containing protein [Treponema sp.]